MDNTQKKDDDKVKIEDSKKNEEDVAHEATEKVKELEKDAQTKVDKV